MSGGITIVSPGPLSLVQDMGRTGYQRYGVSVSGAMDHEALLVGNLLVGNEPAAAAVEVTFGGAEFLFDQETVFALAGADLGATLDGTQLPVWESFVAPRGAELRFDAPVSGLRAYLCCAGGIATELVLGSRSTHVGSRLGGLSGGPLRAGDVLPLGEAGDAAPGRRLPDSLRPPNGHDITVRIIPGPQVDAFTDAGLETFFSSGYTVTDRSDRQGVRLDGPKIQAKDSRYDIVSDAVPLGAVQVPGDGMPIVLLADRQTTGGYVKIGVVATVDLPLMAQAQPGSTVNFQRVAGSDARNLLLDRHKELIEADYEEGLRRWSGRVGVNGTASDVTLAYRPAAIRSGGGAAMTYRAGSIAGGAKVQDITET